MKRKKKSNIDLKSKKNIENRQRSFILLSRVRNQNLKNGWLGGRRRGRNEKQPGDLYFGFLKYLFV